MRIVPLKLSQYVPADLKKPCAGCGYPTKSKYGFCEVCRLAGKHSSTVKAELRRLRRERGSDW